MSIAQITEWIDRFGRADYSDLHLLEGRALFAVKHQQTLASSEEPRLADHAVRELADLLVPGGASALNASGSKQAFASFDGGQAFRARVTFRTELGGLMATCRLINRSLPTIEKLGIPWAIVEQATQPSGLILFAGPTNSGKSSAIAAIVNAINLEHAVHITTIEEPIEFQYPHATALVTQREVGTHVDSYASAIESAKGANPRIIVVGEIRNTAIAKAALSAALSGHLVISTVHAGSVEDAIAAMIAYYPADEQHLARVQLAQALRTVVVQNLVRKDGPSVGHDEHPLAMVREYAFNDLSLAAMIRGGSGSDLHHIRQHLHGEGRKRGMVTKEASLAELVRAGKLNEATARAQLTDPDRLTSALLRAA
ncbi:type IV pilus twitching motility protein, putative PilT (plasmid) [Streptomyces sp. L7]|uniref:type IV pilus twitching motility protein PilT n=1 Tax=Streptomyces sp. L7 TaxID=3423954 RepID=UPI000E1FC6AD|nr:hypothetical protein DOE76_14970 [Leifsonia sp. ku-ls]